MPDGRVVDAAGRAVQTRSAAKPLRGYCRLYSSGNGRLPSAPPGFCQLIVRPRWRFAGRAGAVSAAA